MQRYLSFKYFIKKILFIENSYIIRLNLQL